MSDRLTREGAEAKSRGVMSGDVIPYPHAELERDDVAGGFAFTAGEQGAIIGYDGGYQTSMLGLAGETMETLIAGWLVEQRHRHGSDATSATSPPTHPCPVCGAPAPHADRYPLSVCPTCAGRTTDSADRPISAFNEGLGGGFIVFFTDSPVGAQGEVCAEVMASGLCWIDGQQCSISEARFGGVVVQALEGTT